MLFKKGEPKSQGVEKAALKESNGKDPTLMEADIVYPSGLKFALLMTSIFIGAFLTSLVSKHSSILTGMSSKLTKIALRIVSLSPPPSLKSRMNSIQRAILDGMERHICLPTAPFS
jgi:hypothetical protein